MLWSAGVIRGIGLILTMKHCFDLTEGYYAAYFAGVYEATKLVFLRNPLWHISLSSRWV